MSILNLDKLLAPKAIALIGASRRDHSVGSVLARNLIGGGFAGPILPVHPREQAIGGVLAYPNVAALPLVPDLAVIATPPDTVPGLIRDLAERGCRAGVVITAGLSGHPTDGSPSLTQQALDAGRAHGFRLIGPNCIGIAVPGRGINATFAHLAAKPGSIACLSQSGAIATALLDWAAARNVGFSHMISLGDMADVDFGDMLDYLATDASAKAIVLYVEGITHARKFMSAARAAARIKPVVVIKAGRNAAAAKAASSHTGALAGSDAVYDAAFRRAGMLRVRDLEELFAAVETLARMRPMAGDRLAILTNGGGVGVLATDDLLDAGGTLAQLAPDTIATLDAVLPPTWSHGNPVDIIGDANGARYSMALDALLADRNADAVLVLNCPTAITSSSEAADAVIETVSALDRTRRNVLTSWLGEAQGAEARQKLAAAGIPSFATPGEAIRGFLHMATFRRNQITLLEAPTLDPRSEVKPDREAASAILDRVRSEGRAWLDEFEAKQVLAAYGIPVVETKLATTPETAEEAARTLEGPFAIKIRSRDITHKSDVGGVVLGLKTPDAVAAATRAMLERVAERVPKAQIDGITVQRMIRRPGAFELIVGINCDPTFGPVVLFGQGGIAVEVVADTALALAPLNATLAEDLIDRTRIARQLAGYRARPPADRAGIVDVLVKISRLATELPAIAELDINPLLADENGVIALDARIRVQDPASAVPIAVLPYPVELEQTLALPEGQELFVRPIRPEDASGVAKAVAKLAPEDAEMRFFSAIKALPPEILARMTQIDYDREMALVAFLKDEGRSGAAEEPVGIVHLAADPDNLRAEYDIMVQTGAHGHGIGRALMTAILDVADRRGIGEVFGLVRAANVPMLSLVASLGFTRSRFPDDPSLTVVTRKRPD